MKVSKLDKEHYFLAQFKQHCQPQKDVFLDVYAQTTFTCSK